MDYLTKPTSRKDIRRFARILREVFDVPVGGRFPVLKVLERVPYVFKESTYEIENS